MSEHKCKGCDEYQGISRRNFVGLSTGLMVTALTPGWLPRVVYASSENSDRDVIISIFLRGGADGLTLVVPHGEDAYYDVRDETAVARPDSGQANRAKDLDGFFGLPPALKPLKSLYNGGDLLLVHATGMPNPTRSHFEAMRFMEVGVSDASPTLETGWLGRHLQMTAPTAQDAVLRAVGIGYGLQRTLVGGPLTLPIADLANFGLEARKETRQAQRDALEEMYAAVGDPMKASADSTLRTIDTLKQIGFDSYRPGGGANYPSDEFGYSLSSTAALIKADVGVEAVAIDLGGWDTHDYQGSTDGQMSFLMDSLGKGLKALHKDLFSGNGRNVIVTVVSEFGRNVRQNGSFGTDHGHGGVMMAMGPSVAGGKVLTNWPGLEREQLYEDQDLKITIDYRDVLGEILEKRLGNPNVGQVFNDPDYSAKEHGVIA